MPQLIVGAGHKTHWPLLRACRQYKAMSCIVMKPSLPKAWFDAIIAPAHDRLKPSHRVFTTPGPLNNIKPASKHPRDQRLILLGGDSKHFFWNDEQILSQLETILEEHPRHLWRCFVSRRTPPSFLIKLQELHNDQLQIEPSMPAKDIVSHSVLEAALQSAAEVWVSPDSSSMLYEALTAGAKVSVFDLPEKKRLFSRSKIAKHIELLKVSGSILSFEQRSACQTESTLNQDLLSQADRAARWLLSRYQSRTNSIAKASENDAKSPATLSPLRTSNQLHVLQVLPALESGGVERGTLEIAQALKQHGIVSSVASSGGTLVAQLVEHSTAHYTFNLKSKNPWVILKNGFILSKLIKDQNISLMHVRSRAPAWSCLLASRLSGVPYVSTFHGQYGHSFALKKLYNSAMLRGHACIAVSPFIESHIQREYPHLASKVKLIPRGIEPSFFNPERCKLYCTQYCSEGAHPWIEFKETASPKPVVFFPARFTRLKGHTLIIEALRAIDTPAIKVIFAGKASGREHFIDQLKAKINEYKLPHEFLFLDALEDPRAAYCSADIVISASTKPESFGRTIAEAQAMHCLVLAANHGAAADVMAPCLKDGLFAPNDAIDLARALTWALALDDNEKSLILKSAQQYIYEHYTLEQMCLKTIAVYKEVSNATSPQRT